MTFDCMRPAKSSTHPREAKTWCALKFVDTSSSLLSGYVMQPTRRSYYKSFKAQDIQECAQPGASIASIALNHSLNANLVHKWIRCKRRKAWRFNLHLSQCLRVRRSMLYSVRYWSKSTPTAGALS